MLDVPATAQYEVYRYLRDRILNAELPAEAMINPSTLTTADASISEVAVWRSCKRSTISSVRDFAMKNLLL